MALKVILNNWQTLLQQYNLPLRWILLRTWYFVDVEFRINSHVFEQLCVLTLIFLEDPLSSDWSFLTQYNIFQIHDAVRVLTLFCEGPLCPIKESSPKIESSFFIFQRMYGGLPSQEVVLLDKMLHVFSYQSKWHIPWSLPEAFFIYFFRKQWRPPFSMEAIVVQKTIDGEIRQWCSLTLGFSLDVFGSFPWLFVYQLLHPSD